MQSSCRYAGETLYIISKPHVVGPLYEGVGPMHGLRKLIATFVIIANVCTRQRLVTVHSDAVAAADAEYDMH